MAWMQTSLEAVICLLVVAWLKASFWLFGLWGSSQLGGGHRRRNQTATQGSKTQIPSSWSSKILSSPKTNARRNASVAIGL